jgi:hypothetical protein
MMDSGKFRSFYMRVLQDSALFRMRPEYLIIAMVTLFLLLALWIFSLVANTSPRERAVPQPVLAQKALPL